MRLLLILAFIIVISGCSAGSITGVQCSQMAEDSRVFLGEIIGQLESIDQEVEYESLKVQNLERVEEILYYGSACTGIAIAEGDEALSQAWEELVTPFSFLKLQWGMDAFSFNSSWAEQKDGDVERLRQSNK